MLTPTHRTAPATTAKLTRLAVASVATLGLVVTPLTQVPEAGGEPPTQLRAASTTATDRPNVLLVTVDDMEVSDLGRMPHLKRLVAQGTNVAQGIAPTPICAPSRASLLTGQYAHHHGVRTISGPFGGFRAFCDTDTLPVWLRRAGYRTHFAGKYLNGYGDSNPRYRPPGWDDWYGAVGGSTYSFTRTRFNDNGVLRRTYEHNSDVLADHTVDLIEAEARPSKPWFAWVNFTAPHTGGGHEAGDPRGVATTRPARRHRNHFASIGVPRVPEMLRAGGSPWAAPPASRARRAALREAYQQRAEALLSVDEAVGRMVRALKRTGQWKSTYVIFTSDNGYLVGHHNRTGKLVPYDRSIRIPFYVAGPGIPAGRSRTAATVADLGVTIARIAGARVGRKVDGVNMLPYWRGREDYLRPIPIEGYPVKNGRQRIYYGIRIGDLTYARLRDGREVLFDRSRDPGELRNVVARPAYRGDVRRLRALARAYRDCRGSSCPKTAVFARAGRVVAPRAVAVLAD